MKNHNQAFTLIELLVVVLIIGILAAVAVPQYQKAVEKSRLTEALLNISQMQKQLDLYVLENGYPADGLYLQEIGGAVDFPLDENGNLYGKYFTYAALVHPALEDVEVLRYSPNREHMYTLYTYRQPGESTWTQDCYTYYTDMGEYICQALSSQGWNYVDDNY